MTRHAPRCIVPLFAAASLVLTGCSDDSSERFEAGASSTATTESAPPTSLKDFDGAIVPGSHRVPLISWTRTYPVDGLLQVPEGFITPGGWVVENGLDGTAYGDLMFWGDVDRVYSDPCGVGQLVAPGPTVDDLARAVAEEAPDRTTTPEPVRLDGHRGLYLTVTGPKHVSECVGGRYSLWRVTDEDQLVYSSDQPGSVFHLWFLDVDGRRVVVAVRLVPGHTVHAAELLQMAEGARFVENVDG